MRWTLLFICLFAAACTQQRSPEVRQSASAPAITTQAIPQPAPVSASETLTESVAPVANTAPERIENQPQRIEPVLTNQEIAHQLIAQSLWPVIPAPAPVHTIATGPEGGAAAVVPIRD
jgi:hypothetical protein